MTDSLRATVDRTDEENGFLLVLLAAISGCRLAERLVAMRAREGLADDGAGEVATLAALGTVALKRRLDHLVNGALLPLPQAPICEAHPLPRELLR